MFIFHCKSGDVQVEKEDVAKYGELLKDIVSETNELSIDFEKNDMDSMLYYAYLVYNYPQLVTLIPYKLYPICDFFCMTRMTNPKLYYHSNTNVKEMLAMLLLYTKEKHCMCDKLYTSILDDIKIDHP